MKRTDLERFWSKVKVTSNGGCWEWQGSKQRNGYGLFYSGSKLIQAHRFSYELQCGVIPAGLEIDHLCRNPRCVNPLHLEVVTHGENVKRGLVPEASRQRQLSKTHCPYGHPYNEANTIITVEGFRDCRICRKLSKIRYNMRTGVQVRRKNINFLREYQPLR